MTSVSLRNALLGGAFLAAAVSATPAHAVPVAHTTNWTAGGGSSQAYAPNGAGTLLSNASSVKQGTDQSIQTITGPGGAVGQPITFSPDPLVVPVASSGSFTPTLTASWGGYTFTSTTGSFQRSTITDSIAFLFQGTFTDSTSTLATQAASLSESFTQAASGGLIGFSAAFATPPVVPTPEPATMAILGAGFLGLAVARRRKA